MTRLRRLASSVAVALVLVGCGDDPSVDLDSVEAGIPGAVVPDAPGVVTDVDCPALPPETVAQSLTCTAAIGSQPITVDVDIDADGVASAEVRERLLDLDEVAADAARRLSADLGIEVTVECSGVVAVVRSGHDVACTAAADDRPIPLRIEILDEAGQWTVEVDSGAGDD